MDVENTLGRLGHITGEAFQRFLDEKGVGDRCPTCSPAGEMAIAVNDPVGSEQGKSPAIRLIRRLPDEPHLGYGELMQVCQNCGFIRYFRDIEVLAFLREGADNG